MMQLRWPLVLLATALACEPSPSHGDAKGAAPQDAVTSEARRVCARPARGIVVGLDTIAGFSTHATLGTLRRQCSVGDSAMYDAVGWQAHGWTFPFVGARVMAVQSKHEFGDPVHDEEVPDLWSVEGDSVRFPDGELLPRTHGAVRSRYGFAVVDENLPGDDIDGPHARSCRFRYLLLALAVSDTARRVPDSARVVRVEMTGPDTVMARYCLAHQPPSRR